MNNSIRPIDGTLKGTTISGQSGRGSNCTEGVLHIPQSLIIGALPSDDLVSYLGHSFVICLTPVKRCSRRILQPKPNGLLLLFNINHLFSYSYMASSNE